MSRKRTISRTKAVNLIDSTKGRFFTVTFLNKGGIPRTINCNTKKDNKSALGYIRVYSFKDKGYRSVNPHTITELSFGGTIYKVRQ